MNKKSLYVLAALMIVALAFSLIQVITAAPPNPGHRANEIGGTLFADRSFQNAPYAFPDRLSIGTTAGPTRELDVDGRVRIRGGNPAAGKVLTATGTAGYAEWQDPPVGNGNGLQCITTAKKQGEVNSKSHGSCLTAQCPIGYQAVLGHYTIKNAAGVFFGNAWPVGQREPYDGFLTIHVYNNASVATAYIECWAKCCK